jgi:hypothetical protein
MRFEGVGIAVPTIGKGQAMIDLLQSLALSPHDRAFTAHADPRFETNSGMYGGWTAALMAKAALTAPGAEGAFALRVGRRHDPKRK